MGDTLKRGMEDAGYGGRFGMGGASMMQKYMNYNPSGQLITQVRKIKKICRFSTILNNLKN